MPTAASPAAPPRLSRAPWLERPATRAVFAALAAGGHRARAVGGAVRNALLGLPVADIDLATTARPDEIIAAAQAAGLVAIPTGLAHGTVTVVADHVRFEVTSLRRDVESLGRHAVVAFTEDWAEDARRRDFTLNALYCDADGTVHDPLGGYPDLAQRRVRFIGDAALRIREDYLRILRFFRLTAQYGVGAPDGDGLAACVRERAGLALLSGERVRQEMLRLLIAPRAPELVATMFHYGLLPTVLHSAPRPVLFARLFAAMHAAAMPPDGVLLLASLAVEVAEDAVRLAAILRLSNPDQARLLRASDRARLVSPSVGDAAIRALLYADGPVAYRDRVLLTWARSGAAADSAPWRHLLSLPGRWTPPHFPITGTDVMALAIPAGPRVGDILRTLEAWWVAGDFAADERGLRAKLRELGAAP